MDWRRRKYQRDLPAAVISAVAHLVVLAALIWAWRDTSKPAEPEPMTVALVDSMAALQPLRSPASSQSNPAHSLSRPRPTPRRNVKPLADDASEAATANLSDADLASASTAGSGPPGGPCNMARRLQDALRKDALVQDAIVSANAAGKAIFVWNGDWVRNGAEEGKGLAAVREAMVWEIAFAPAACRTEPVHGLVLLSLNDGPGGARLAVGSGEWRWSDLLNPRRQTIAR